MHSRWAVCCQVKIVVKAEPGTEADEKAERDTDAVMTPKEDPEMKRVDSLENKLCVPCPCWFQQSCALHRFIWKTFDRFIKDVVVRIQQFTGVRGPCVTSLMTSCFVCRGALVCRDSAGVVRAQGIRGYSQLASSAHQIASHRPHVCITLTLMVLLMIRSLLAAALQSSTCRNLGDGRA